MLVSLDWRKEQEYWDGKGSDKHWRQPFPVIKAADLYSRMHWAKTKVKEIVWITTEIVWFTTEIYKIHSVNTVSFYTKVEIIKWNPCTLVSKPEKMCLKHTVKLWNVLLQYIFYDNRLHRFKMTIMKLIGAKSYKDCWTQINYLWLKGSLNYNFTVQLFQGVRSHVLSTLCSSLGTCYWPLQDRR